MNRKGFVFVETLTVLIVLVLSLTLLITSYSLVARKSKASEYYNLPSDKYLLYAIANVGNENVTYNHSFIATNDSNSSNYCENNMSTKVDNCSKLFTDNNLVYFIIINDGLHNVLNNSNVTRQYDSPTIEYLKTLKRCSSANNDCTDNYLVGVFYRNGSYYYASIEL